MALSTDYQADLLKRLADPGYAAEYLSACAAEGQDEFLLGLRQVAEALGGISQLAADAELNREGLYRMLSEDGNPRLSSLFAVLKAFGLRFQCVAAPSP
jgi:probable addiction module antidote protein